MPFQGLLRRPLTTLSIEGTSVRLLQAEGRRVTAWLDVPLAPDLVREGLIQDPQALSQALGGALDRLGGPDRQVRAALPGTGGQVYLLSFPKVKGVDPDVLVQREMGRLLGVTYQHHNIHWAPTPSRDKGQRYYVLAVPTTDVQRFVDVLQQTKVRPIKLEARSLCLARAVGAPTCLVAVLEPGSLELFLVHESLPLAGACRLLEGPLAGEELALELQSEVQRQLGYYRERYGITLPDSDLPLYLAGSHADLAKGAIEGFQGLFTHPLQRPRPALAGPGGFSPLPFMVNIGLALGS
ncbi:MAG: hypothetical protein HY683_09010 [Chloroflexi bacterium]|nr:hypothetical protein [Chloroflexota bacterium]